LRKTNIRNPVKKSKGEEKRGDRNFLGTAVVYGDQQKKWCSVSTKAFRTKENPVSVEKKRGGN